MANGMVLKKNLSLRPKAVMLTPIDGFNIPVE